MCQEPVRHPFPDLNPSDNADTDTNTLWEEIFSDGFESGDTRGWS